MIAKPFPYQLEGVEQIRKFNGRALLADEPGLGKSASSLLYAQSESLYPCVIVCPASLKWNWEREISKHLKRKHVCSILEGTRIKNRMIKKNSSFLIINWDILKYWWETLRELPLQLIIIDEAHFGKDMKAQRTKALRKLCKGVDKIIALSGTPLTNRPSELFSTINLLRPDLFPNFYSFAMDHCHMRRTPWGVDYSGAKRLPLLHKKLTDNLMIRRRKVDVLKDLPGKIRSVVTLPIETPKEYQQAETDFLHWLRSTSPGKVSRALKAQKIVQIGMLKRLAAQLKLKYVMEWIDNFLEDSDEKLIVFAVHKAILKPLAERYKKVCVLVDGEVSGKKRQDCFDTFTNNPKCRLFLGNIQAGGTGWNGTVASTVAFAELPWTPAEVLQGEDRANRIGSKSTCFCVYLIANGTLEEDLCEILQKKQAILSSVLDGKKTVNSLDVYDQLEKILRERK